MTAKNHNYTIRIMTVDGMLVEETNDFAESAVWDWFSETVNINPDDIVQLIDGDIVLAEEGPIENLQ